MASYLLQLGLLSALVGYAGAITYTVSATASSSSSVAIDPAAIGVSIEFFAFPAYIKNVSSTTKCLSNLKDLTGTWPPMRIGGTTQDRATYNASSPTDVTYTVASPSDAPTTLTYGPSFLSLAGTYNGSVILGLNRRLNNISNSIAAAKRAVSSMKNLNAFELGNEPNFYSSSDPIAGGSWSAAKDFASQVSWQSQVGGNLSATNLISAGVAFGVSSFSVQGLAAVENNSLQYVKDFCSHNYPQSQSTANLTSLMSHKAIASQISSFKAEIAAAQAKGKPFIMGETNSATQGGGGISPTYGAGLWLMDYSMQLLLLGTKALYFHQGTIGNCQYCWWGRYNMGAPYYGAYFATLALAGGDKIAALDDFSTAYAAYAIYKNNAVIKVLLYNSDYYTGGTRSTIAYTLTGLTKTSVAAKRLTAASATSRQDQGSIPTFGGQSFVDGTCAITGTAKNETTTVSGGKATFTVGASEALLIYL